MKEKKEFVACVSLGYYCGVAASLEKYGLRSFSGPFDWTFSSFQGILQLMENDFSDFLCKENLRVEGKKFFDTRYELEFPHEVHCNFEKEFDEITERYHRRIEKFRQKTKEGVCFLRAIEAEEELQWVLENDAYIETVIKKNNSKNEIRYLIPAYLDAEGRMPEKIYQLSLQEYKGETPQELRSLLDPYEDFVTALVADMNQNIYKDNMIFSLNKWVKKRDRWIASLAKENQEKSLEIESLAKENQEKSLKIKKIAAAERHREQLLAEAVNSLRKLEQEQNVLSRQNEANEFKYKILAVLHSMPMAYNKFPKQVDIYGVGHVGKVLCDVIQPFCKVGCFIDNFATIKEYNKVPVKTVAAYRIEESRMIVVTSPHDFEAIASMLQKKCGVEKENILPVKKFLAMVKKTEENLPSYRGKRKKNGKCH